MKKYNYIHAYNEDSKEYHDYYHLIDVVNSMSADRFAKNVRHAIALSIFDSGYARFGKEFEELRQVVCIERLKEEYYRIKMKNDRHLIGTDICGFDFYTINAKDKSYYVSLHLSVQVINKQLKFVITYHCDIDGEEIRTTDLDVLYNKAYDWANKQIREERQRKEQLAADLAAMGVLPKLKADKKSMFDMVSAN